mgnify:FL=1
MNHQSHGLNCGVKRDYESILRKDETVLVQDEKHANLYRNERQKGQYSDST